MVRRSESPSKENDKTSSTRRSPTRKSKSPAPTARSKKQRSPSQTSPTTTPLASKGTPSQTLYIRNLNEKIHKKNLKETLYFLFAPYGRTLDIVTLKTIKMRGQAHIVFRSIPEAASAMKALDGSSIFKKEMEIQYARGRSKKAEEEERRWKFDEADDETEVDTAWSTAPLLPEKHAKEPTSVADQSVTADEEDETEEMQQDTNQSTEEPADVDMT